MPTGIIGSLLNALLYLGIMTIPAGVYLQYKWYKDALLNVRVLVKGATGDGTFYLVPKSGNSITLQRPGSDTSMMWPISELATVSVPYPGVGFLPDFMQTRIQMCQVDETDWEPMLNRGPYQVKIMSPDMKAAIQDLADNVADEDLKADLEDILAGVTCGQTREMIASPSFLHNLVNEKISQVAITVYKDVIDPLKAVIKQMGQLLTPNTFYVGLAALALVVVGAGAFGYMQIKKLSDNQIILMHAQGILTAEEQAQKAAAEA